MPPTPNAIGLVARDLPRTLAFYRALGLDFPAETDAAPHVEVALPGGMRLLFDTVDAVTSFDKEWEPPTGSARVSLAFECASPEEVDAYYAAMTAAGWDG